jgi:tRNA(Ile2) C34 agmatinyltransferase TiaS
VFPGFAINTIFYAAMLWLLWIAPGKIRRFVRVHRGRCPACGYQIDSAPGIGPRCSECGHLLTRPKKPG